MGIPEISGNTFITSNKDNANNYGLSIAKDRQMQMAESMINDDSESAYKNGNFAGASGITGAAGLATLVIGLVVGGPVGVIAAGGVVLAGGAAGAGIFGCMSAEDSTAMNEDINFYEDAAGTDYGAVDLGLAGNKAREFSKDSSAIPSKEKRAQYANELENGSKYRTMAIYNPENIEGKSDYAELHDINIDSSLFTSQPKTDNIDKIVEYDGYNEDVITTDKEYGDVMAEYSNTFNGNLSDENMDRLVEMAKAMSTNLDFEDDKKFFDINGDGYLNNADLYSLKILTDEKTKEEFDSLKDLDWTNRKANEPFGNYTNQQEILNNFDFDGNGCVDNNDKDLILNGSSSKVSSDINGDGVTDEKDSKILTSYMKANVERLNRLRTETKALEEAMGGDDSISNLANVLGIELK